MLSYGDAKAKIARAVETLEGRELLQRVVEVIQDSFPHYSWTGIYMVRGDHLVLEAWKGPQATEHVVIPIGQGVCGAAAASGQTEVVDDVSQDPRYLMCFPGTRSEIVVPIKKGLQVLGEIDIDSDELAAFTDEDRRFLEEVAAMIADKVG